MASLFTATTSERAAEDTDCSTDVSPEVPSMDREPEGGLIVPALNLSESSIEDACQESTIAMDVSLVMLPVDAADVPLPDEESDRDEFETSPNAEQNETSMRVEVVKRPNNKPADVDTVDRGQDDDQSDNSDHHDMSLTSASSAPSSPKTPNRQEESQTDDEGLHDTSTSSMPSIGSSPKTPKNETSSSDPFVLEDPTKGLSLDNLDLKSPNWMEYFTNLLKKIEHIKPNTKEILEPSTVKFGDEEGEYQGPIIALPDTPDYHPYSSNFQIRLSKYGGFGTFATRDLKLGEVILIEKPLLKSRHVDFYSDFRELSEDDQQAFMQLYTPPGDYLSRDGSDYNHIRAILKANSFAIPPYDFGIIGVYNAASRLNHACSWVANVDYTFDANNSDAIVLNVSKLVKAGSELFISYGGSPLSLYERYGFRCCCGGCKGVSDQHLTILKKIKNGEISRRELEWI